METQKSNDSGNKSGVNEGKQENECPCKEIDDMEIYKLKEEDRHIRVQMNRLPAFSDFVWEKFETIDGIDPSIWVTGNTSYFFLIGTSVAPIPHRSDKKEYNMSIIYFVTKSNTDENESLNLLMKDGSVLDLTGYSLHLDLGSNPKWIGDKLVCYAEHPLDPNTVSYFYLF